MTRSVQRAIDLLEALKSAGRPLSLAELADAARLDRATTLRLARDLSTRGLVEHRGPERTYRLGWRLADLAGGLWNRDSLPQVALRHLEELRDRSLQTAELCSRVDDHYVVLLELPGLQSIKFTRGVGTTAPIGEGAAGRVLLAHDAPEDRPFDPSRPNLDQVRIMGFAYVEEPDGTGSATIAAPVFGPNGTPEAAVCLLWVGTAAGAEPWDRYRALVMACARRISRLRGATRTPAFTL